MNQTDLTADHGLRSAVTGGKQMDGFINLFTELVVQAGLPREFIFAGSLF